MLTFTVQIMLLKVLVGICMLRQQSLKQSLAAAAGKDVPPAKSNFEFNRDLCLMVCTDLLPFNMVSGTGFSKFFAKNFPDVKLPSQSTLSTTALYDLYRTLKMEVKKPSFRRC